MNNRASHYEVRYVFTVDGEAQSYPIKFHWFGFSLTEANEASRFETALLAQHAISKATVPPFGELVVTLIMPVSKMPSKLERALAACVVVVLFFSTATASALSVRESLSQLESGNNDRAIGRAGEVSRYQILPAVWRRYSPHNNFRDAHAAWIIAQRILAERTARFTAAAGRAPTDFDLYVLWNAPGQYESVHYQPQENMTETKLTVLVAMAVALDRELQEKTGQFKEIKRQIVAEAESREDEHETTEGGGTAWTAQGTDGCIARVNFPAPSLKSKIDRESPSGSRLLLKVGKRKEDLFTPVLSYVPVENFRERVREFFKPGEASKIIAACETKSAPRVSFETKSEPTKE